MTAEFYIIFVLYYANRELVQKNVHARAEMCVHVYII